MGCQCNWPDCEICHPKNVCECVENTCDCQEPVAPEGYVLVPLVEMPGSRSPGEKGHYSSLSPEPYQIIQAWGLDFDAGSALKYLARYPRKGGVQDLQKVIWYAERLIEREEREGRG